jgi:predicted type IV restriction endonuclease
MSYREKLKTLAQRIPAAIEHLHTEEATKNALVMPFIAALGYDVFNPLEVIPEFIADVGIKKGEKIDYAIKRGDEIILLFEAKKAGGDLSIEHASQLFRYFTVTHARIAVLTNGIVYRFFSDLDEPNKMDKKPFLEINMLNLNENLLGQLDRITKGAFDLEGMLSVANDLKYMGEIRRTLEKQLDDPDEEFVRFFFSNANPNGRFIQSARDQFTRLVKQTFQQLISDRVSERLRSALAHESSGEEVPGQDAQRSDADESDREGVVTTEEELEGFRIVQAIICQVAPTERITYRDTKSYFGILFDDNNRRPICRLHFNRSKKYLGLFDEGKNETRHALEQVSDLYKFTDQLRAAALRYLEPLAESEEAKPNAVGRREV